MIGRGGPMARVRRWHTVRGMRSDLDRFLRSLVPETWCYLPNPGNVGDALIHAGTVAALDRASVRWEQVGDDDDVVGRSVFIGGGGNLVPAYDHMSSAIHRLLDMRPSRIVVLPHGIRGHDDVLERLRKHDVVLVRDHVALRLVRERTIASVAFAHDMAFHVDAHRFLRCRRLVAEGGALLDQRLSSSGLSRSELRRRPTVRLMRGDLERRVDVPSDFDPSVELMSGGVTDLSPVDTWAMLACVDSSRTIETDRLHVAVSAALLGVPTTLYPNTYGKNRAVYEASLSCFPDIEFVGDGDGRDR